MHRLSLISPGERVQSLLFENFIIYFVRIWRSLLLRLHLLIYIVTKCWVKIVYSSICHTNGILISKTFYKPLCLTNYFRKEYSAPLSTAIFPQLNSVWSSARLVTIHYYNYIYYICWWMMKMSCKLLLEFPWQLNRKR